MLLFPAFIRALNIGQYIQMPLMLNARRGLVDGFGALPLQRLLGESGTPQVLLAHHIKQLKLQTVLREYDRVACAGELQSVKLLIIDELGYVPLSSTGAELLFETFSQRYERGSTIVTSNLPF